MPIYKPPVLSKPFFPLLSAFFGLLFTILNGSTAIAQSMGGNNTQTDSLDVDEKDLLLRRFLETDFGFDTTFAKSPDTTLLGVHWYDPSQKNLKHTQTGGILGSFARPMGYETGMYAPIRLGFRQYELYDLGFTPSTNEYWQVTKPLTVVDFMTGGTVQQHFKVMHTQNIGETFNVGAEYRLLSSEGFYINQATNNKSLRLFASFLLPGNRYAAFLNYINNNRLDEQNGGIGLGTLFDTTVAFNPLSVPTKLTAATSRHNQRTFQLSQYYRLSGADSSFQGLRLFHRFSFSREYYRYTDLNPIRGVSYYPGILRDSTTTFDTTGLESFTHLLGIGTESPFANLQWQLNGRFGHGTADLGFGRENYTLAGFDARLSYQIWRLKNQLDITATPFHSLQSATYAVNLISQLKMSKMMLTFMIDSRLQNPDLISLRFLSNHHSWNQNFSSIRQQQLGVRVDLPILWASIHAHQLENGIFYAGDGRPFQQNSTINILELRYGTSWRFWKMQLQLNHSLQQTDNGLVRIPAFSSHDMLHFEHRFKTGWLIQTGVEVRYNSSYRANAFRPETGQFVIQDSLSIGNYPVVDLFLAIKVKRTRLFARFEHANQGFPRPNVFATPLYPMYGRAFRFGVSWGFYN